MKKRTYLPKLFPSDKRVSAPALPPSTELFETLSTPQWIDLISDVIHDRPQAYEIFRPAKGDSPVIDFSIQLKALGAIARRQVGAAIQEILASYVISSPSKRVRKASPLISLLHIAAIPGIGVYPSTLLQFVLSSHYPREIRIAATRALTNQADDLPIEIWEKIENEALGEIPELAQPILFGLGTRYPAEALSLLTRIKTAIPKPELLESPLRLILRKVLAVDEGLIHFAQVLQNTSPEIREILKRVLGFREFSKSSIIVSKLSHLIPSSQPDWPLPWGTPESESSPSLSLSRNTQTSLREGTRIWIEDSLAEAFDLYRNSGSSDLGRLEALLAAVGENPSISIFSSLVGFFESVLLDALSYKTRLPSHSADAILIRVLESFGQMPAVIRKIIVSPERDLYPWVSYRRCLQIALKRPRIAERAFESLVTFARESSEISLAVRIALTHDHFTAEQCRNILLRYWPPITCDSIFLNVVDFRMEFGDTTIETESEAFQVATKLGILDVRYIDPGQGEERLAYTRALLDDKIVPLNYRHWARFVRKISRANLVAQRPYDN